MFGSGTAAVTACVFAFCAPGTTLALAEGAYFGTGVTLAEYARWGLNVVEFDQTGAPPAGADVVWVESPANPQMTVHLEDGNQAVIVEGTVEDVIDVGEELYKRVTDVYAAKYNNYRPEDHGFFVFRPQVAFGWRQFPQSATRWRFDVG